MQPEVQSRLVKLVPHDSLCTFDELRDRFAATELPQQNPREQQSFLVRHLFHAAIFELFQDCCLVVVFLQPLEHGGLHVRGLRGLGSFDFFCCSGWWLPHRRTLGRSGLDGGCHEADGSLDDGGWGCSDGRGRGRQLLVERLILPFAIQCSCEPLHALLQALSRGGDSPEDFPSTVSQFLEFQLLCDLFEGQGIWSISEVGPDHENRISQHLLPEDLGQLLLVFFETLVKAGLV
mmetsp:Transcript_15271/g.32980  ORF Transcript_15271/g.32980 Transcript_15271/m.32980 type:complete len:234 (+) Transcript_15271:1143-1844(+)